MASDGGLRIGSWVIGASALLAGTLLAGRISGLFREVQLAASFGVSVKADVAVLLLTLPDLLVNMVLSGGLSAALIPRLRALPVQTAQILSRQATFGVFFLFALLALIFVLLPDLWFSLLAPGLNKSDIPPTAAVVATALAIPLAATSGVITAILNSQQKFLVAGFGTLIFNVIVIIALVSGGYWSQEILVILGAGIALGAALRLFSQLIDLPRGWLSGPVSPSAFDSTFILGFMSTAATASLMLLVPVIVRAFASTVNPGAIAAMNYATKLVELPVGVLVTSLATVTLVRLSAHHGNHDQISARQVLHSAVKRSFVNAVGIGFLIAYFANTLIELALGRGAMDSVAISRVVSLTQILLVGLPFIALASMAMAELNAKEQSWVLFKVTVKCLFLLPILALPGIYYTSEKLLVWSIVGFQMIHGLWLSQKGGLILENFSYLCDGKFLNTILIIFGIVGLVILIDILMQSFFENNIFLRFLFAILTMAVVIFLPQRYLADSLVIEVKND